MSVGTLVGGISKLANPQILVRELSVQLELKPCVAGDAKNVSVPHMPVDIIRQKAALDMDEEWPDIVHVHFCCAAFSLRWSNVAPALIDIGCVIPKIPVWLNHSPREIQTNVIRRRCSEIFERETQPEAIGHKIVDVDCVDIDVGPELLFRRASLGFQCSHQDWNCAYRSSRSGPAAERRDPIAHAVCITGDAPRSVREREICAEQKGEAAEKPGKRQHYEIPGAHLPHAPLNTMRCHILARAA